MARNDVLVVDIDSTRDITVVISHAERSGDKLNPVDSEADVISDMVLLCEALVTLIHVAENEKVKDSPQSLRDCINHIEQGFADASYFAYQIPGEK